ncbi:helix-turn-helix transcriptional regulator [Flavonifractor sp. An10]|uniref:helix-turn-helix domain-containing protein n=1 Tax=Flavonifractor sp. An10 TaxID=1965537 RepID=UPI000B39B5C2|nr:helix-turn-helix transcriptional regulator [Flavonifractor sp. An10]OUQ79995.1 transcriptional regulator [Flavonifractor sp. An10]
MVTMAQRIEALRTEAGLSRPAASQALGFPKNAFEKFETGRQTPAKEQQEKMASYFGVSLFYLRGESNDRTRQEDWMSGTLPAEEEDAPVYRPAPAPKKVRTEPAAPQSATMLDALFAGKAAREQFKAMVLEVLRSPEGQAVIAQAVWKELAKHK